MNSEIKQQLIEGLSNDESLLTGASTAVKFQTNGNTSISSIDIANKIADAFFYLKVAPTRDLSYKLIIALTLITAEFEENLDLLGLDELTSAMEVELFNNFATKTMIDNIHMTDLPKLFRVITPMTAMGVYMSTTEEYAE